MKRAILFLLPLLFLAGCKSVKPIAESNPPAIQKSAEAEQYLKYSDQSTWILGYFKREQLYRTPHCEWYLTGYDNYKPDSLVIGRLKAAGTGNISIKVVMGTWCPDSRREVPRFLHILDLWQFPGDKVTFIGVDEQKQSPVGEYQDLGIQRVPTFIVYKNNVEAGRIIENPVTSLEQDMLNILARNEK
jgi:thiol-disulfide isomerase/thioredoxin